MFERLYKYFIEPQQQEEDLRNREYILNVLLIGTLLLLSFGVLLLIVSYTIFHHTYVVPRMAGIGLALVATWWTYYLSRSGWHKTAAWALIVIYLLIATGVAWRWGVSLPSAAVLFGLVIMVAGTVLSSPNPLYIAGTSVLIIGSLEIMQIKGLIRPDLTWASMPLAPDTVSGFCLLFGIIGLISWLFNERTEDSLGRARRAEAGLLRQKLLLESKVEERTRELQAAQLERMQQLYRFAELGQLSTALMHDLANHLTTLTLDIEGLESEQHSRVVRRAKRSIRYIDEMVLRVRDQLHGKMNIRQFNVATETNEVISILNHRASEARVSLSWAPLSDKKLLTCKGEPVRFRQLMANMINNAIDSYDGEGSSRRDVEITLESVRDTILITVTDWGKGIPPEGQEKLFEPFFSTKKTGMGMGLFIAKQIITEQFHGTISLDSGSERTAFIITLAKA
jgi:signal transduction histidine kinase